MTNNRGKEIGVRLLLLRDYFCANANETHAIKMQDIEIYLCVRDMPLERKMIYTYIDSLTVDFGLDIEYSPKYKGYILHNPPFENYELRLMIDSIQSSKFITQEKARVITDKIKKFADNETQLTLGHRSYAANRIRSMNDSVVKDSDKLHAAIVNDNKVSFKYFHYTPSRDKPQKYSKEGNPYIVSPYALLWNNGNYYLYAFDGNIFRYFRIDRMERITRLDITKREGKEEFKLSNVTSQKAKVFDMYSGPEYMVEMRFRNELADQVIDTFGKGNIMMFPCGTECFTITHPIQVSPPFYAWISTFGNKVKILSPASVVAGMRDFLRKSIEMYEDDGEM